MKILKWLAAFLIATAFAALGIRELKIFQRARDMRIPANGINESLTITIGGVQQWINVRGHDRQRPFILFIDGGPGKPSTPYLHLFQLELEKSAVIVHWEQRGAGKSYSEHIPKQSMHIAQFVNDGIEVSDWIRKKYGVSRLVVLGHSWGSMLGMLMADKAPDRFSAFIGVGQAVSLERGWAHTWTKLYAQAKTKNDHELEEDLRKIGPPPWSDLAALRKFFWLQVEQGCEIYGKQGYGDVMLEMLYSPLYSLLDHVRWYKGQVFSAEQMQAQLRIIDLATRVKRLHVPVYFFLGHHDCNTPYELAEEYLENLKAPQKTQIWFENSSHSIPFEEPALFQQRIAEIIAKL